MLRRIIVSLVGVLLLTAPIIRASTGVAVKGIKTGSADKIAYKFYHISPEKLPHPTAEFRRYMQTNQAFKQSKTEVSSSLIPDRVNFPKYDPSRPRKGFVSKQTIWVLVAVAIVIGSIIFIANLKD